MTHTEGSREHTFQVISADLAIHILAGAIVGVLVLHPVTMVVYYFEFHQDLSPYEALEMATARTARAFSPHMWPMTSVFVVIGGMLGLGSGVYSVAIARKMLLVSQLDRRLATTIELLIRSGETEFVEFKSSLRWDHELNKCNKSLEVAIIKTIAGFLITMEVTC